MNKGNICIYYGEGHGKSTAAMGRALETAAMGGSVFIIQFLKGRTSPLAEYMKKCEPEIKIFQFEKKDQRYEELNAADKEEEKINIRNAVGFARKVLATGECQLLVLDEFLGVLDVGIISVSEFTEMLAKKSPEMDVIVTGRLLNPSVKGLADELYMIKPDN